MQVLAGDKTIQFRLDPLSKKNRLTIDTEAVETGSYISTYDFMAHLSRNELSDSKIERRGSVKSALELEYIFQRIRADKYVSD